MRNMLDRIYDRRRRLGHRDDEDVPGLNERIERELVRDDEDKIVRGHEDGRRSATTGY